MPSIAMTEAIIRPMATTSDIANSHFVDGVYFFLFIKTMDNTKIMRLINIAAPHVGIGLSIIGLKYKPNSIEATPKRIKMIGKTILFLSP